MPGSGRDLLLLGGAEQLDHALVLLGGVLHLVLHQGGAASVGHGLNEHLALLDLPHFLWFNATDLIGNVLQEEHTTFVATEPGPGGYSRNWLTCSRVLREGRAGLRGAFGGWCPSALGEQEDILHPSLYPALLGQAC